jgi:hypothetical protein
MSQSDDLVNDSEGQNVGNVVQRVGTTSE